jgi:predicted acylesterase/phospholipase RssA
MDTLRKCDIVMQGGVTSGIVYPGLVCKLAEYYQFQQIGGTSAGAIAAALTAAAEYARRKGKANAFEDVAKVSTWLGNSDFGKDSNLLSLFQPQDGMKGLFKFSVAFLVTSVSKRFFSWLTLFWLEIIIGIVPGAILGYLASGVSGWSFVLVIFLAFVVCFAGICATAATGIIVRLSRLPRNFFGLCTGHAHPDPKKPPALVPWLNDKINEIAGKSSTEPLTFGDLENAGITLRMMTTCLTWGRPFTLPLTIGGFYFSPEEFRTFFPEEIVRWLETHPPKPKGGDKENHASEGRIDTTGLHPLPDGNDLPVIVAARLSLSFPFLFCTVPLYAFDWTLRQCKAGEAPPEPPVPGGPVAYQSKRKPEHVWFTDGGICNNFPLHLFDGPVPRWPTFGIDLTELRPDRPHGESRAWMPTSNREGTHSNWTRLTAKDGLAGTLGLVFAIIDSARNWVNSLQAIVPGYRDRIVHIALNKHEGGLNLSMPPATLASLNKYGCEAAELLIDHFIHGKDNGVTTAMTWDNQRWIRYRSTMTLLETFLSQFAYTVNNPEPGDVPYSELIKRNLDDPPQTGYRFDSDQTPYAVYETNLVIDLGTQLAAGDLQKGSPRPKPALVIRPNF